MWVDVCVCGSFLLRHKGSEWIFVCVALFYYVIKVAILQILGAWKREYKGNSTLHKTQRSVIPHPYKRNTFKLLNAVEHWPSGSGNWFAQVRSSKLFFWALADNNNNNGLHFCSTILIKQITHWLTCVNSKCLCNDLVTFLVIFRQSLWPWP